jgi:D-beta-D-heptose 7-phosphate kinase/D-beta-D-heptose 1-phosphate adenosyltransferase
MQSILDRLSGLRVVVFGDIILDHYILGEVSRLSPEAPVPVILVTEDIWSLGGAANVALNLKELGTSVEVIGLMGTDAAGDHLRNLFVEKDILFDEQQRIPSMQTIIKTRILAMRQQICRIDREKVDSKFSIENIVDNLEDILHSVDLIILSDYGKGALTQNFVNSVVEIAHKNRCFVAVDPKPISDITYGNVDLLTPNMGEALTMAGVKSLPDWEIDWKDVCKKIYQRHAPKYLVITLGADGMLLAKNGQFMCIKPTCARDVYDVSGAGDTVIASLAAALTSGSSLEDSANLANIAAGIVVEKFGTATATPSEIINHSQLLHKQ